MEELGLVFKGSKVIVQKPDYLNQTYETEHYRFHFTLDSTSINKVENFDYIIQMGEIFEQVWLFFMDTLDFDPPVFQWKIMIFIIYMLKIYHLTISELLI